MEDPRTDDIGGRLRAARRARGLTLHDVAGTTKISIRTLQAIELNQLDSLPGGLFRKAYVRAFAAAVGLDPDALARDFAERFEPEAPNEPAPLHRADFDSRPLVERAALLAAGCGVVIAGWLLLRPAEPPGDAWLEHRAPQAVLTGFPVGPPSRLARGGNDEVALATAADPDEPALRLELRLNAPCWLSAEADGERVAYRLLQAGERIVIEAHEAIELRLGDAGAVAYSINDVRGKSLGVSGEAITVRLTPDNLDSFLAGAATIA